MTKLTDYTSYADAQAHCSSEKLWELFDGDREQHEHRARMHRPPCGDGRPRAVVLVRADGEDEILSFARSPQASSRFAHCLVEQGIRPGDRVAVMLEPSLRVLRRHVRRDEDGRDRGAAVHAVRPRRHPPARAGLQAAHAGHQRREGAVVSPRRRPARGRRRRRLPRHRWQASLRTSTPQDPGQRPGHLPVHLRHHARAARRRQAHAPRARHADAGGAVRHRHAPGRPLHLPVLARLGPRPVARHAGAAGAWA